MEGKNVANNLVITGFILFFISSVLLTFITGYLPNLFPFRMSNEEIVLYNKIILFSGVITIMLNTCALGFTVIGGKLAEKSREYWFILVGLILLITNSFIGVAAFLVSLSGIAIYFTEPMLLISYIIPGIGLTFIIIGGLLRLKNRNLEVK
ncbi:MAG: hypothetical protein JSV23_11275 [Promethearchaeota archaeon]|nr:MAG: hypothetical protein JSV23_11275 [Candidatus Lokiarchaeota archaeon]